MLLYVADEMSTHITRPRGKIALYRELNHRKSLHCFLWDIAGLSGKLLLLTIEIQYVISRLYYMYNMAHKYHDPCFHVFFMEAGVMTFVAHGTGTSVFVK